MFDQVTIMTPSGHKLLSDFKFIIEQENNVMIIGPNGSGKTSIMRVLCGLWSTPKGEIIKSPTSYHNKQQVLLYLPQTPYLVFGSLRDQLTYPLINDEKNQHGKFIYLLICFYFDKMGYAFVIYFYLLHILIAFHRLLRNYYHYY